MCLGIPLPRKGMKRKARSLERDGNGCVSDDSESEDDLDSERPWMLETWSRPSTLSADDKYRCNVCRCLCEARQRSVIANPPSVLMFHLKRFACTLFYYVTVVLCHLRNQILAQRESVCGSGTIELLCILLTNDKGI